MKILIQRSKKASVEVNNEVIANIDNGMVLFVGFTQNDNIEKIDYMINKILNIRIFDDENGIMNKNIIQVNGSIISVSQFTLYADSTRGNRPDYIKALKRDEAIKLYDEFNKRLKSKINVETGIFGADMKVKLINDGPVTIMLER